MIPSQVDEFETRRGRLFGLAYRMLGSAAEAEDVVQDAALRWSAADRAAIEAPGAWLTKVVTNLCITRLRSARSRRERYVGLWLPEPLLTEDDGSGPPQTLERRESVSLALLTLLEHLTPAERAVFVLREAFGHPYRDIAEILDASEAGCRQLHHRALGHLGERPRFHADREGARSLIERFLAAVERGDLPALERLLAEDVTYAADSGGKVPAARRTVAGRERVLRLIGGLHRLTGALRVSVVEANAGPALMAWLEEELVGVLWVEVAARRITSLRLAANPDKLAYVAAQARERLSRVHALPRPPSHETSDSRDRGRRHARPGGGVEGPGGGR